jgi:hypothetical protein
MSSFESGAKIARIAVGSPDFAASDNAVLASSGVANNLAEGFSVLPQLVSKKARARTRKRDGSRSPLVTNI